RFEKDTENLTVKAWARHVYYDLLGNVLVTCAVDGDTIGDALNEMALNCTQVDHGFRFGTDDTETMITADWSLKGMVEAQLDPDEGLASLGNLRVIRDNYDVFFVKRSTTARAPITYGRTLLGVRVDINEDAVINRIVPVGKTSAGDPLLTDTVYVDSPRNDAATMIRAKVIEYDAQVGDDYPTEADVKTELTARANADFEAGIDLPEVSVNVNMLQLGDTEEYQQYKDLDRLYLGDLIRVIDNVHGVDVEAEINEYDFDCLAGRYTSLTIGVTDSMRLIGSVSGFMIPDNAVSSTKIVGGTGNADTLDGHDSTYFATAEHDHDAEYLGLTAKAADADKLGGIDADDYSTTQQTNDSIKLAVTSQSANLFPSDPSDWSQGSISSSNGSNTAATNRIRSADYITLNAGTLYTVSRVKSLTRQIFLHYYNSSNTYIGNSGWVTTYPYSFSLPSGATKIRVLIRKAGDSSIYPTDVPGTLFSIVPAGVSGGVHVDAIYPVGAIYMSNVSTSPSTLFGGTWSAISNPPTGASYWWERT
ncbi:MAG: hypothetical protein GX567_19350, partial [Clostridia bacterium]|nr:hypothetical protein [Clostridia bacterium]